MKNPLRDETAAFRLVLLSLGRPEQARESVRTALRHYPKHAGARAKAPDKAP